MKKLFLMAILATGMVAFAQENRRHQVESERIEQRMTRLTSDLELNEQQQADLKKLLEEQSEKREAKMAEMEKKRKTGVRPTDEEREAMQKERETAQKEFQTKLKSILTEEQFKKWEASSNERQEAMKKRKERRQ